MPEKEKKSPKTTQKTKKANISITKVLKRDGSIVAFDLEKIKDATYKAMKSSEEGVDKDADYITEKVHRDLLGIKRRYKNFIPSVEGIQDTIEKELINEGYASTAKNFILYRDERSRKREERKENENFVSKEVRDKVKESSKYFAGPYNEFVFYRTYSRWMPELGRRETWTESIDRFINFMEENLGNKLNTSEYNEVKEGMLNQDVCSSMRLLWSSGKACRSSNVWAYNCSYIAPTKFQDLGEIMYVLMCGSGLGFSVESENVQQFPQIKKQIDKKSKNIIVEDSKEGWADAFVESMKIWSNGGDVEIDYSKIRPSGARLDTAGGRASGPQPLKDLIEFSRRKVLSRQGKRLSNIDLHDIICQIGLIVVAGGVRRSALISLSDPDDKDMRDAKKGQFYLTQGQRSMANNSAVYVEKPDTGEFLDEWTALVKSKSGERGIFNRGGLEKQVPERRWKEIKKKKQVGMNPCGEIYLQSKQFCNLTSIVVRPNDDLKSLKKKIELATILGTYQSTLTNFKYLSSEWKKNCDKERLLGVSITGYYDNKVIRDEKVLTELKSHAISVNKKYAKRFGINESTAITCVKPHGNSGQLLNVGSGMHPWFAPYFIRRVRINHTDPLLRLAKDQGVPCLPEVGYSSTSSTTFVLEFPVKAPKGAIFNKDVSALEMLNEWKKLKENFVEHNPSVTVYSEDKEWIQVANFVYENWDIIGGLAFLPKSDHVYQLAPYEEISKEEYEKRTKEIKTIDFSKLVLYESQDNTQGAKEYACVGGNCEV